MAEQINVSMEPWFSDLPPDDVICSVTDRMLDVFVEQEVGSEFVPIGEFFRFARALDVRPRAGGSSICSRCESEARYEIAIEWEEGYECPKGNSIYEHCVAGVVSDQSHALVEGWAWPTT